MKMSNIKNQSWHILLILMTLLSIIPLSISEQNVEVEYWGCPKMPGSRLRPLTMNAVFSVRPKQVVLSVKKSLKGLDPEESPNIEEPKRLEHLDPKDPHSYYTYHFDLITITQARILPYSKEQSKFSSEVVEPENKSQEYEMLLNVKNGMFDDCYLSVKFEEGKKTEMDQELNNINISKAQIKENVKPAAQQIWEHSSKYYVNLQRLNGISEIITNFCFNPDLLKKRRSYSFLKKIFCSSSKKKYEIRPLGICDRLYEEFPDLKGKSLIELMTEEDYLKKLINKNWMILVEALKPEMNKIYSEAQPMLSFFLEDAILESLKKLKNIEPLKTVLNGLGLITTEK